jgi:hypothetical protein
VDNPSERKERILRGNSEDPAHNEETGDQLWKQYREPAVIPIIWGAMG